MASEGTKLDIYNSIFYNQTPREIVLENTSENPCSLYVQNSLVAGGQWNVGLFGNNSINWNETTNLYTNPLFVGSGEYPYAVSGNSSVFNAGTLNLPAEIELPEFDLAICEGFFICLK